MIQSPQKLRALEELALTVKLKGSVHFMSWCQQNCTEMGYLNANSMQASLFYSIRTFLPEKGIIRRRGYLTLGTPEEVAEMQAGTPTSLAAPGIRVKGRSIGKMPKPRFTYGIPKDPPDRRAKTSFVANPKDVKMEREEKVERKAPPIRFSDAYVFATAEGLREGKMERIDFSPIADMLDELLELRAKHGRQVNMKTEPPGQRQSLGGLGL